jgi:hypothetical protein
MVLFSGMCVTSGAGLGLDHWTDQMVEVLVAMYFAYNLCSCVNHAYEWENVLKSKLGQELKKMFWSLS